MRKKHIPQASIFEFYSKHENGQQLKAISMNLDENPHILEFVAGELLNNETKNTGREGLSVESIIRISLLKQMMGLTYNELSFYLADSLSYRSFTRIENEPSTSSLQSCVSLIDASLWEKINTLLLTQTTSMEIEKGRMVRIDSTVTETNIHPPTDSSLLWDCIRVMVSQLLNLKAMLAPNCFKFQNHTRTAKKKARGIVYSKKSAKIKLYQDLLALVGKTKGYLSQAILQTEFVQNPLLFPGLKREAEKLIALTEKVISQTQRRVLRDEKVPHADKVFSIFEAHTDIIIKGSRDIQYGHKINLTTGKSGLVLDIVIEEGNPADTARLCPMIERQIDIYGRVPRQVAADGGYASHDNLSSAKELGVKDMSFQKKRGLKVEDMAKSQWVYKKLCDFRAGVEGNISCLKRRYSLSRCNWQGIDRFKAFVWSSTVAYNLMTLARLRLSK
jgi:IS5 family transposase